MSHAEEESMPHFDLDPIDELRQSLQAADRLAKDPEAFAAAYEAFLAVDAGKFQAILDGLGLGERCHRICWIFCTKRCTGICFRLCPDNPGIEVDAAEVAAFVQAMARVDKRSLERLVGIVDRGDADGFKEELARLDLQRFCSQICRFLCRVRCRRVCRELCDRPQITRVSSIPTSQFDTQGLGSGPSIPPFQVPVPNPGAGVGDHPVGGSSWLMGVFNMPSATEYKVEVALSSSGPWTPIAVTVNGYQQVWPTYIPCTRSPSGGLDPGWYQVNQICVSDGGANALGEKTLLYWPTPASGLYWLRLWVRDGTSQRVSTPRPFRVDNDAPATPVITLELLKEDGSVTPLKCGQVKKGDGLIRITVQASDPNFSRLSVNAQGNSSLSVPVVAVPEGTSGPAIPLSKTYNGNVADTGYPVPTSFIWDPWNDPNIVPCCYVVRIDIWDRAVVNNVWGGGHGNSGWEAIEIGF